MNSTESEIEGSDDVPSSELPTEVPRRQTTTSEAGDIVVKAYLKGFAERLEKINRGEKVREI